MSGSGRSRYWRACVPLLAFAPFTPRSFRNDMAPNHSVSSDLPDGSDWGEALYAVDQERGEVYGDND